jgi:hypothetical protein
MSELTGASGTITPAGDTGTPATDAGPPAGQGARTGRESTGNSGDYSVTVQDKHGGDPAQPRPAAHRDVEAFLATEDRLLEPGTREGADQPAAIMPESAGSPESSYGDPTPSGTADGSIDALVAQEEQLLSTFAGPDDGADNPGDATNRQVADEPASSPATGKDEPGPAGIGGRSDPAGKPDNDRITDSSQAGQPESVGQPTSTPEHAEPPEAGARQEAAEAPSEPGQQQPDPPEATPGQQPEGQQSVQALVAEQVAAIKAEIKAEYDAELASVKSELAQVKEALAAQSKTEASSAESAKKADPVTESDTTKQGAFIDRGLPVAGKDAEGRSKQPARRAWNSDARLDLYAAVGQTMPSVAAAIVQPDVVNVAAAAGTIFATAVAGLLVRRSERQEQGGH